MKRGDVWWANLRPPIGRRPVLLLSRDVAYTVRASVTIAPITRTVHNIPVEVRLGQEDGLSAECVVNLDGIQTVPKQWLENSIATLSPSKMDSVEKAIKFALDLH